MSDIIRICDLEVHFRVGVPDEERSAPQRLLLSLDMGVDFSAAAATEDLSLTVDYGAVCATIQAWGAGRSWVLIERLALDIAGLVLGQFRPAWVRVQVKKFILPNTRWVSVEAERSLPST